MMIADVPVVWLVMYLALESLRHGVQVSGSPGSGKSVLLKAFRGSLATLMRGRPKCDLHLIDFDAKRDLYALHRAFPEFCPVFDINPFVAADAYDPVGDLSDPRDIGELMGQLIDTAANSSQPFFPQAAMFVLNRVTTRHWLEVPDAFQFADIILTGNSPERLRLVANSHEL